MNPAEYLYTVAKTYQDNAVQAANTGAQESETFFRAAHTVLHTAARNIETALREDDDPREAIHKLAYERRDHGTHMGIAALNSREERPATTPPVHLETALAAGSHACELITHVCLAYLAGLDR